MTTLYYDADGNEVTALSLVTKISVTCSINEKQTGQNYDSRGVFLSQSLEATVPPGLDDSTIRQLGDELYHECASAVAERLSDTKTQESTPGHETISAPATGGNGQAKDWGVVHYAPKVSELGWRDTYQVLVTQYKAYTHQIEFHRPDSKYPLFVLKINSDVGKERLGLFAGWEPIFTGELTDLPGEGQVKLHLQCTGPDRQTSKGNPYVNLIKVTRVAINGDL